MVARHAVRGARSGEEVGPEVHRDVSAVEVGPGRLQNMESVVIAKPIIS